MKAGKLGDEEGKMVFGADRQRSLGESNRYKVCTRASSNSCSQHQHQQAKPDPRFLVSQVKLVLVAFGRRGALPITNESMSSGFGLRLWPPDWSVVRSLFVGIAPVAGVFTTCVVP
jgi:hypothetical protein